MKKLLTLLMVAAALLCGGINADAQKKSGKSSSSGIKVEKNEYGYYDPSGHTYKISRSGVTMSATFYANGDCIIKVSAAGESETLDCLWEQEENVIYISTPDPDLDGYMVIGNSGRTLTDSGGGKMTLVK